MQTSEYRHLDARAKRYLSNPNGRRLLKAAVHGYGKALAEMDPKSKSFGDLKDARSLICGRLRRRKAA